MRPELQFQSDFLIREGRAAEEVRIRPTTVTPKNADIHKYLNKDDILQNI